MNETERWIPSLSFDVARKWRAKINWMSHLSNEQMIWIAAAPPQCRHDKRRRQSSAPCHFTFARQIRAYKLTVRWLWREPEAQMRLTLTNFNHQSFTRVAFFTVGIKWKLLWRLAATQQAARERNVRVIPHQRRLDCTKLCQKKKSFSSFSGFRCGGMRTLAGKKHSRVQHFMHFKSDGEKRAVRSSSRRVAALNSISNWGGWFFFYLALTMLTKSLLLFSIPWQLLSRCMNQITRVGKTCISTNLPQRFYRLVVCDRRWWPAHEPMPAHNGPAPIRPLCAMWNPTIPVASPLLFRIPVRATKE